MQSKTVPIQSIKLNPDNPRVIKDAKFKQLVKSIQDFPEMLQIRPIVVNADMIVLGGNQRLKACIEAGLKEVPVIDASDLTEEQQKEFIVKDNIGYGEWDWAVLQMEYDVADLEDWGLDVPLFEDEPDYSILDDEDVAEQLEDMAGNVKKAIQIEFESDHYEEAFELVKFWRDKGAYIGGMIMEYFKAEKAKL